MPPPNKRPPLTHFLCLPLTTPSSRPQLQTSLARFALEVNGSDDAPGGTRAAGHGTRSHVSTRIPREALRPPGAIHFTIGVMSLQTEEQVREACDFLQALDLPSMLKEAWTPTTATQETLSSRTSLQKSPAASKDDQSSPDVKPPPIIISLSSLHPMQAPSNTSSLYAAPEPLDILQPFAQSLHDAFLRAGLLLPPPLVDTDANTKAEVRTAWKGAQTPVSGGSKVRHNPRQDLAEGHGDVNDGKIFRPLRIHATIVNTVYAGRKQVRGAVNFGRGEKIGDEEAGRGMNGAAPKPTAFPRGYQRKLKLDAREIIDRYRGFQWARDIRLDRIAICEMGAKRKMDKSATYVTVDVSSMEKRKSSFREGNAVDAGMEGIDQMRGEVDEEYVEICAVKLP